MGMRMKRLAKFLRLSAVGMIAFVILLPYAVLSGPLYYGIYKPVNWSIFWGLMIPVRWLPSFAQIMMARPIDQVNAILSKKLGYSKTAIVPQKKTQAASTSS